MGGKLSEIGRVGFLRGRPAEHGETLKKSSGKIVNCALIWLTSLCPNIHKYITLFIWASCNK
jgi:hypothetical protein